MNTGECLDGRPQTTPAKSCVRRARASHRHLGAPHPSQHGPSKDRHRAENKAPASHTLQAIYCIQVTQERLGVRPEYV